MDFAFLARAHGEDFFRKTRFSYPRGGVACRYRWVRVLRAFGYIRFVECNDYRFNYRDIRAFGYLGLGAQSQISQFALDERDSGGQTGCKRSDFDVWRLGNSPAYRRRIFPVWKIFVHGGVFGYCSRGVFGRSALALALASNAGKKDF